MRCIEPLRTGPEWTGDSWRSNVQPKNRNVHAPQVRCGWFAYAQHLSR
jgi:hypothetical protein